MKTSYSIHSFILLLSMASLLPCGCTRVAPEEVSGQTVSLQEVSFTAICPDPQEGQDARTRTEVQDESHVWWSPGDCIKVFHGESSGRFQSDQTVSTPTATFSGRLDVSGTDDYLAVYPFDEAGELLSNNGVSVCIPWLQYGVEGSFDPAAFPSVARSKDRDLSFRNVCGGVRFSVSRDDIRAVSFRGNGGSEILACRQGQRIVVYLNEDGDFSSTSIGGMTNEVILLAPEGGTFLPGSWYYISLFPCALNSGYTLSFITASGQTGSYTSSKPVTLKRSGFGSLTRKDEGLEFTPVSASDLSAGGAANCYIVPASGSYFFPAVIRGHTAESLEQPPVSAEVLWESYGTGETPETGALVSRASYDAGHVSFSVPSPMKNGNAVIAVKDRNDRILWSWHIWLCSGYSPSSSAITYYDGTATLMDRNLGATSATHGDVRSLGLLYQWGRKDPFLSADGINSNRQAASTTTSWSLEYGASETVARRNPTAFAPIRKSGNFVSYSYLARDEGLWNSEKGASDPCPAGWRVPDKSVWDAVERGDGEGIFNEYTSGWTVPGLPAVWYPAAGGIDCYSTSQMDFRIYRKTAVSTYGTTYLYTYSSGYWSCDPGFDQDMSFALRLTGSYHFDDTRPAGEKRWNEQSSVELSRITNRENGLSVRCQKIQ